MTENVFPMCDFFRWVLVSRPFGGFKLGRSLTVLEVVTSVEKNPANLTYDLPDQFW